MFNMLANMKCWVSIFDFLKRQQLVAEISECANADKENLERLLKKISELAEVKVTESKQDLLCEISLFLSVEL